VPADLSEPLREDLHRNIAADVSERPVLSSNPLIRRIGGGLFHVKQHRKQQPQIGTSRMMLWLLPQYLLSALRPPNIKTH